MDTTILRLQPRDQSFWLPVPAPCWMTSKDQDGVARKRSADIFRIFREPGRSRGKEIQGESLFVWFRSIHVEKKRL